MMGLLEKGPRIGGGSYGVVYKSFLKREVAAKILHDQDYKLEKQIENEIKYLESCKHTNIVSFFGTTVYEGRLVILMEYADCGSLKDFLHGGDKRNATLVGRLNWMLQLANGMAYLHDKNIVHRDLKPPNLVLFDKYKTLKICDFGLVRELATNNTEKRGTFCYMAPEVYVNNQYTTACDVFSFGIVLWEVLSNKEPFYESNELSPNAMQKKINNGLRPCVNDVKGYPNIDHIKKIMKLCWDKDENARPTMKGLAYILGIDSSTVDHETILNIKPFPSSKDEDFM